MELRATLELGKGRGGQVGEEDPPLYSERKDPTVTHLFSPRHAVLSHRHAVLPQGLAVLPLDGAVLPLTRQRPDEALLRIAMSGRTAGARALAVLPQGRVQLGSEGTD